MYAVQKDIGHLKGQERQIVYPLRNWLNNLFNVGTYEGKQKYFKDKAVVSYFSAYTLAKN